jgi:hypothetical protein
MTVPELKQKKIERDTRLKAEAAAAAVKAAAKASENEKVITARAKSFEEEYIKVNIYLNDLLLI